MPPLSEDYATDWRMRIVRVNEIWKYNEGDISKTYIMWRNDYLRNPYKIAYEYRMRLLPYKIWQIWYLIEVPAFYLQQLLNIILRKSDKKKTHIATFVATSIIEATIGYCLTKLFDYYF